MHGMQLFFEQKRLSRYLGKEAGHTGQEAVLVRSRAIRQAVSAGRATAPVLPLWDSAASPVVLPDWDAAEGDGPEAGEEAGPGVGEVAEDGGASRHCWPGGER